jgi:hypothetical protein
MSSIFDKIITAINASIRGARPSQRRSETPRQEKPHTSTVPDVTDASQDRAGRPEVTEAPLPPPRESSPLSVPAPRISHQGKVPDNQRDLDIDGDLEDGRIVDLLKDNDA